MAYKIFSEVGLFKSFEIPVDLFINYFVELERGYMDLPCNFYSIILLQIINKFNLIFFY
jgi:hypothetical protein